MFQTFFSGFAGGLERPFLDRGNFAVCNLGFFFRAVALLILLVAL